MNSVLLKSVCQETVVSKCQAVENHNYLSVTKCQKSSNSKQDSMKTSCVKKYCKESNFARISDNFVAEQMSWCSDTNAQERCTHIFVHT